MSRHTEAYQEELEAIMLIFEHAFFNWDDKRSLLEVCGLVPSSLNGQWDALLGLELPPGWVPSTVDSHFALRMRVPCDYPSCQIELLALDVWWLDEEQLARTVRDLQLYLRELPAGEVVLFEFLDAAQDAVDTAPLKMLIDAEARDLLLRKEQQRKLHIFEASQSREKETSEVDNDTTPSTSVSDVHAMGIKQATMTTLSGVTVHHGTPFMDRKSVFQAHFAKVSSVEQVREVQNTLLQLNKIARATHNITCYRLESPVIPGPDGWIEDHDSDGESAAGGRLHHMFHLAKVLPGSYVMVTRWYGGIQLGPDRFRHINNAAREILLVDYGAFDALAQDASFTLRSPNVQVDASEWSSVTNGGLGLARSIRVAVFSVCLPKCMVQHGPDTARLTIRYKGRTCWDGDTPVTRLVCIVNKVICLAYAPGAVLDVSLKTGSRDQDIAYFNLILKGLDSTTPLFIGSLPMMMNYRATDDPSAGQAETNIPIISLRLELNWDHQKAIDNYSIHMEDLNLLYSEDTKLLLASLGVRQDIGTPQVHRRVVVWQDHLLGTISAAQPLFRQQESAKSADDSHRELTADEVDAEREAAWKARQAALDGQDAVESVYVEAERLEVGTDAYDPPADRLRPEMKDAETDLPDFARDDSADKISREMQASRQQSEIPVERDAAPEGRPPPRREPPTRKLTRVSKRDKIRIEPTVRVAEPQRALPRVRKTYEPGGRVLKGMSYADIEEYYVDKVEGLPLQLKRTQDPDYTGHYDYNHIDLGSSYVCYVGDAHGFDNYYQIYPENKGAFFDTCCAACVDEHEFDAWSHAPGYLDLDEFTRSELLGDECADDVETESGGFTKKTEDSTDDTINEDLAPTVEEAPPDGRRSGSLNSHEETLPEGRRSGSLNSHEETLPEGRRSGSLNSQKEPARKSVSWDVDEREPESNLDE